MTSLLDLPLELLDLIISILAEEKSPATKSLYEDPPDGILRSGHHPLKDLSQACHATRGLCFPSLFSAVKVDINSADEFLIFSETHSLFRSANSLVLYLDSKFQPCHFNKGNIWLPLVRVIDSVKPSVVTVLLSPSLFQLILPYDLNLNDQWAFGIGHQVLQLRLPCELAASSQTSRKAIESQNVFQIREWTHCAFNQGSSLPAYSTYEFFAKTTPSVFNPQPHPDLERRMTEGGFANLTSLDYVALFPLDDMMEQFCMCLDYMKKLKCLRVQLAPTPSNDVLDNPTAVGKCQPGDLWQEFEDCYNTLAEYIWERWSLPGPMSLEEFTSLDYVNPRLRELLDGRLRLITGANEYFKRDPTNGGRWTRTREIAQWYPVSENGVA